MALELIGGTELALYFDQLGDRTIPAAVVAMGETCEFFAALVRAEKLSGDPLQRQSGNLADAIAFAVEPGSDSVVGRVFVDPASPAARYGAVHEFGGLYRIPEHLSHSRLGNEFTVRAHEANFAERSFLRSALSENAGTLGDVFAAAFAREMAA